MGTKYTRQSVPWTADLAEAEAKFRPVEKRNQRSFTWTFLGVFIGVVVGALVNGWAVRGVLEPACRAELARRQSLPDSVVRLNGEEFELGPQATAADRAFFAQRRTVTKDSTFRWWQPAPRRSAGANYGCAVETNGHVHFILPPDTGLAELFDRQIQTVVGFAFVVTSLGQLMIRLVWPLKGDPKLGDALGRMS